MKILRVFPRKTSATPNDRLVTLDPPGFDIPEVDEVHVSVTFTWDIPRAEKLAEQWSKVLPTKIGGPAYKGSTEPFVPGKYLKTGYVITSRGCPNKCWFCFVWKRQKNFVELPITNGYILQDDNLLACSDSHIKNVFAMLKKQKEPAVFSGGIEASKLKEWHCEELKEVHFSRIFLAYDTKEDWEPLVAASKMFKKFDLLRGESIRCYCLIGFPGDTFEAAEKRLINICSLGLLPFAMLYRDKVGNTLEGWSKFQRSWMSPAIIHNKYFRSDRNKKRRRLWKE